MSYKGVKKELIERYGPECFIDKLHLRKDDEQQHYYSKGELKRMKELTYHHIEEKKEGGKATVENGALLSRENHDWFNKQSPEEQRKMNEVFQKYKQSVDCKIRLVDDLDAVKVAAAMISPIELEKGYQRGHERQHKEAHYNRAKERVKWKKEIDKEK